MIYPCDDHLEAEQLHTRYVGESLPVRPQQLQAFEDAAPTSAEIDQQLEQVRWMMRREPMLESQKRL